MSGVEAISMACNVMTQLDPAQRAMTSDAEKRLRDIAAKCLQYSKDIEQEIASTSPKKSGIPRALKSTVKTMWRKPHLDQLKGDLQTTQSTMDTAVNVQILEQCIASGNLGREIYDRLDSKERSFIANYEQRSQAIEDLIKQLDGHITEEHINTRGRITEEHIATRESVTNKIGMMETNNRQELGCKRLLNSLNYPRMNERKNAIPERHDGTFEWVFEGFESEKYSTSDSKSHNDSNFRTTPEAKRDQAIADLLRWLRGDGFGMFWISGKPGSGKSTFVKFIMSDERTRLSLNKWRSRTEIITYFFWKPGTLLQQNFQGLLCSLLHQVLSIDVDVCAQLLRKSSGLRHKHVDTDWALEELKRHLFMALRSSNRSYLILLDGLDEMAKPHRGPRELFDFLDTLMKERRVKLCLSSRPERIFLDRFSSCLHLRMHDVNFEDIRNFTAEFFDDLDLEPHDPKQFSILREILGKADGVFIWVHLVLQNVRNGVQELGEGWDEIYQRVLELPSDLMRLYKDMWSRLDQRKEHYVEMAALYFNTVRWANGGFTLACLAVATDNAILESFTERNQVPTLIDLVKRCDYVHRTLFPISAGLLETQTSIASSFAHLCTLSNHDDPESLSTMEKWDTEYVRFTHRTAIDFLDRSSTPQSSLGACPTGVTFDYAEPKESSAILSRRGVARSFRIEFTTCFVAFTSTLT
uniref:Nephrocystin 3-like N-terminal domain-containing protein n=1 Tax=Colletotrichum fructicola (strain Nara gc5) TaxID=1213859 RepID=L2G9U9_COLFN